jgi:hypothetical protein
MALSGIHSSSRRRVRLSCRVVGTAETGALLRIRGIELIEPAAGVGGSTSRSTRCTSSRSPLPISFRSNGSAPPAEQLVQDHPQRIDVAARIDVGRADAGLLGAHVLRVPITCPMCVASVSLGQSLPATALATPKSITLAMVCH